MEENLISRIKQIEAELVRRCAKGKIDLYNTGEIVHQKQVEFHKCNKKNQDFNSITAYQKNCRKHQ